MDQNKEVEEDTWRDKEKCTKEEQYNKREIQKKKWM